MNTKRLLILSTIGSIFLAVGFFVFSYSFIEFTFDQNVSGAVELQRGDGAKIVNFTNVKKKRILVNRGSYATIVKSDGGGFLGFAEATGFLRTKNIEATLEQQNEVTFIAENPSSCVYQLDVLYSLPCGDRVTKLGRHVPATKDRPSYVEYVQTPLSGFVEGATRINNNNYVFLKTPPVSEDQGPPHSVYKLSNGKLTDGKQIKGLDENTVYRIESLGGRFVAISETTGEIVYFDNNFKPLDKTQLDKTINETVLRRVLIADESIIALYSNNPEITHNDFVNDLEFVDHDKSEETIGYYSVLKSGDKTKTTQLNTDTTKVVLCGEAHICQLNEGGLLTVNDLNNSGIVHELNSVSDLRGTSDGFIALSGNSLLSYSFQNKSGSVLHTLPTGVKGCGIKRGSSILLCVNDGGYTNVLSIDDKKAQSFDIHGAINKLRNQFSFLSVGINHSFVFITPDLGEQVYLEDIGSFGFPKSAIEEAKQTVEAAVSQTNLSAAGYTTINTYDY